MLSETDLKEALHSKDLSRADTLLVILSAGVDGSKMVARIKELAKASGCNEVSRWNVSESLKRAKPYAIRLPDGWALTSSGRKHVADLGVIPQDKSPRVKAQASQLRAEMANVPNSDTRTFVEESIAALEAGMLRSSVVLSWAGAVSLLYDHVMANCLDEFNREAAKRDPKWKQAKIKDDLARMKEADFLDLVGCPPLSILSKNVKEELKNNCLSLRNAAGHPSSMRFGESRVSAHLEILIMNVFSKF